MTRVIGLDVSTYQDSPYTTQRIDFKKAVIAGARFVIIRSSWSNVMDDDFAINWVNSKAVNLIRGAYHFYDYRYPALGQADFFCKLMANDPAELPLSVDLEYYGPYGPLPPSAVLLSSLKIFFDVIEQKTGRKGILYTNPSMIAYNLGIIPDWLLQYPLWIAHYINADNPTFKPWANWTIWQYTSKGDGVKYGMESANVDMNYFNGDDNELRTFARLEPRAPMTDAEKLQRLWDAHPDL
jgi:lysozyme